MNKAVKIRYYIESLCVYDFKQDEIIGALYDLLNSLDSEAVLIKQSRFFNLISSHHSFRHYVSKLILTMFLQRLLPPVNVMGLTLQ